MPHPRDQDDCWTALLTCLQELARRCDTLIRLVEKENEEVEAAEREERKKSTKKTSASRATDSSGAIPGGSTKVQCCRTSFLLSSIPAAPACVSF